MGHANSLQSYILNNRSLHPLKIKVKIRFKLTLKKLINSS